MSDHSFNPFIAQKYNINIAIILNSIVFWTRTNAAKNKNFHEGRYWCYGTPEYFNNYFPYFTYDQIRRTLEKAIENDLLIKSNFNQHGYDRTSWYSLTDKALSEYNLDITCLKPASDTIRQNCQMDSAELPNGLGRIARPIPVNKTVNKTVNKKDIADSSNTAIKNYEDDLRFMAFYDLYPRKAKPKDAWKAFKTLKPDDLLLFNILENIKARISKDAQWQHKQFIPYPATFLRSEQYKAEILYISDAKAKKPARMTLDHVMGDTSWAI